MKSALPLQAQIIYVRRHHGLNSGRNEWKGRLIVPFLFCGKDFMENLNFYTVDLKYVAFLQKSEEEHRGFCRIPNMNYGKQRKPKFLCGIVLRIKEQDYYVPVSSYKKKKPDNFLIKAANGKVVSSLRFNYMFPVPKELISERKIATEPDRAYRALLSQELQFCVKNQDEIRRLAERTYRRVLLGKDPGLVANSCDFLLLEERCVAYMKTRGQSLEEKINEAKAEQPPYQSCSGEHKLPDGR